MEIKRGNLGYLNGFKNKDFVNLAYLIEEAEENNWPIVETKAGRCMTKHTCKQGKWSYSVDSSD